MTVAKPEPPAKAVAHRAIVATPPTAPGKPFTVTVPSFSAEHVTQVRHWESRGAALPAAGDEVLLITDDVSEPWAAVWTPSASLLEEGVTSVFGRSGEVVAETGDYTVSQITGAAAQAALEALETKVGAIESEGLPASGKAGGVLAGEYPNPSFAVDMATQAELDAHIVDTTAVHGIADTAALVLGPGAAKDGGLVAFDGTTGKKIKAAGKIVAEQIEAGTITAELIAAHTITAKEIAAGTITATEIAAATITGANIAGATITASNITIAKLSALSADLGTITAGTVTGATLRTAAAGSRVVIDSEGLHAFNATEGVLDFNIGTGNLTLKGEVKAGSTVPASTVTGELTAAQIKEITAAKVAGKLTAAQIESIAATQVTGKLTNAQLEAIEAAKITGTLVETQIGKEAISTAKIQANAITSALIAANTIVAADIAAETITAAQIAAATITTTQIAATTIVAGNIAAETITGAKIAGTTIEAKHLVANTITAGQIAAGTITTTEIKAATITGANIAATTIETGNLKAEAVTAAKIAALTITAAQIAATTITGAKIAAETITAAKLSVEKLSSITADVGTITAGTLKGTTIETSTGLTKLNNEGIQIVAEEKANPGAAGKIKWKNPVGAIVAEVFATEFLGDNLTIKALSTNEEAEKRIAAVRLEAKSKAGEEAAAIIIASEPKAAIPMSITCSGGITIIDGSAQSSFLQLTGLAKRKINFGTAVVEWVGGSITSKTVEVEHKLGAAPPAGAVLLTPLYVEATRRMFPQVVSTSSTKIALLSVCADAVPGAGVKQTINWLAIG